MNGFISELHKLCYAPFCLRNLQFRKCSFSQNMKSCSTVSGCCIFFFSFTVSLVLAYTRKTILQPFQEQFHITWLIWGSRTPKRDPSFKNSWLLGTSMWQPWLLGTSMWQQSELQIARLLLPGERSGKEQRLPAWLRWLDDCTLLQ